MKRWFVMAGAMVLMAAIGTAMGEDKPGEKPQGKPGGKGGRPMLFGDEAFKKMDANNDGKVSLEEFKKVLEGRGQGKGAEFADRIFQRMDANSDGFVTPEEMKKAAEQFKNKAGDGKGKRPGGKKKPGENKEDK